MVDEFLPLEEAFGTPPRGPRYRTIVVSEGL
jgi:hypothetical protein